MASTGEDLQPNELRLNRKGSTNVPSVKVTTRASRPGPSNYRGTGRILPGSNRRRGTDGRHQARRSDFTPRRNDVSESSRATAPRSSGYSHSSSHTASGALPLASLPTAVKREAASPDLLDLLPPKRPRQHRDTHRRHSPPDSVQTTLARRPPNENSITVDLPLNCWKGGEGYKKARQDWLGVERRRVERAHKVKVNGLQYLDRQVVFFCKVERPPEARSIVKDESQDITLLAPPKPPPAAGDCVHHGTSPSNATTPHSTLPQKQSSSGTSSTQQALHNLQHRPHHTGTPIRPVQPIAEVAARRLEPESNFNASNTSTSNTATEPKHQLSQSSSTEERRQAQPPQTPIPQRLKSIASPSKNSSPNTWDRHSHPQHGSGSQGPSSAALLMPEDLRIPQEKYDKTRRVLLSPSRAQLMSVTMHGIVDNANLSPLWHKSCARTPANPTQERIDDACVVRRADGFMVVLGHARDNAQISLLAGADNDKQLKYKDFERPWNPSKKGGVSALCAMLQPLKFSSGGYDHVIHLWDANEDSISATSSQLAIKHSSVVQSLLPIRDTSHKLVSACAGGQVNLFDLSSERVVNAFKVSGAVYNCHTSTSPFCTLLEVAHREVQFEIRDHRMVPEIPAQRFGYNISDYHGRFIKGDSRPNMFACGGRDGRVRIWDLRHSQTPSMTLTCFESVKVIQVNFEPERDSSILACSANNEITRIRYTL